MENHIKIYYKAFNYDLNHIDKIYVQSELSENPYNDIHHIISRGKKGEDRIENLMAVTRKEHEDYGDRVYLIPHLLKIHRKILEINNIEFDPKWFEFYIKLYETKSELKA
jgi:hypothetical protein